MQVNVLKHQPPVVVVGSGGSGTRVVAEVLMKTGLYFGRNLNAAFDNMDFAFALPGRITWLKKNFPFETIDQKESARDGLSLFLTLNFKERLALRDRLGYLRTLGGYLQGDGFRLFRTRPFRERVASFLTQHRRDVSSPSIIVGDHIKWGFKLPAAILCLNFLIDFFPGIKIVHVVRDGRDMAFGKNQRFLLFYGDLFGLKREYSAQHCFVFWSRVNRWAYDLCTKLPEDQYSIVRFEDICLQPKREIDRLLAFLDLQSPGNHSDLYDIPQKIPSVGRWKDHAGALDGLDESVLQLFRYV